MMRFELIPISKGKYAIRDNEELKHYDIDSQREYLLSVKGDAEEIVNLLNQFVRTIERDVEPLEITLS